MGNKGRRQIAGVERTPSGAISRSKASIAKRTERAKEASKDAARRQARIGRTLQEKTQNARGRVYSLTAQQAASHHAESVEGRLYLKNIITRTELLAIEHYHRAISRFARETGAPGVSANPLAKYVADKPRSAPKGSGAGDALAVLNLDNAERAIQNAGHEAVAAIVCVCRRREELPVACHKAFVRGVIALVSYFRLDDPDRASHLSN